MIPGVAFSPSCDAPSRWQAVCGPVTIRASNPVHEDPRSDTFARAFDVLSRRGSAPGQSLVKPRADRAPRASFFELDGQRLWVRGVTYGTFRPDDRGHQYGDPDTVERDFESMAAHGFNAVRTYTVPPRWLLDLAQDHGLHVLVGLPWEQHVAFLDERAARRGRSRAGCARACGPVPGIRRFSATRSATRSPPPIVRWHGPRRVERFIERLADVAQEEDPDALVTYVNYPSTEYLELPFLDLVCFNVYLESRRAPRRVPRPPAEPAPGTARSSWREIGLDSRRNGDERQAQRARLAGAAAPSPPAAPALSSSPGPTSGTAAATTCDDWDFGLTDARPAAQAGAGRACAAAFARLPFPQSHAWPAHLRGRVQLQRRAHARATAWRVWSASTIPTSRSIVVDDGSTDATAADRRATCGVRVISTREPRA